MKEKHKKLNVLSLAALWQSPMVNSPKWITFDLVLTFPWLRLSNSTYDEQNSSFSSQNKKWQKNKFLNHSGRNWIKKMISLKDTENLKELENEFRINLERNSLNGKSLLRTDTWEETGLMRVSSHRLVSGFSYMFDPIRVVFDHFDDCGVCKTLLIENKPFGISQLSVTCF